MIDLPAAIEAQRTRRFSQGMLKTWEDLARYRQIIQSARPAVILETGTFTGESAAWFRKHAPCVISVDIIDPPDLMKNELYFVQGSSVDPSVVKHVVSLIAGRQPVLVSLDSDHSASHVYEEMSTYADLVTVGSYMVVEDGIFRWLPEQLARHGSSPLDAIERFLSDRDDFIIDRAIEDAFPQTQSPSGWLRRVG